MKRKNDSGTASIQAGTISSFCKITIIALGMLSFSMVAAFAADTGENTENKELAAMISELEQKIEAADKRMVAHPSFIQELRELAGRYRARLRHLFFRDTFKDGNYDQDPKWIVKSGAFQATPEGWLSSTLALPEEAPQSGTGSEQKISAGAEAVGILLDNIFGLPEKKSTAQEDPEPLAEPVQPAAIYTKSIFSPAFEMQIEFQSEPGSRFDITLLGSESLVPKVPAENHCGPFSGDTH